MSMITRRAATIVAVIFNVVTATAADKSGVAPVLEVNGEKISREQFVAKNASRLFQAQVAFHEAQRKVLEEMIDELLLEQQAKNESITVAALLDKEVNAKLPPDPSDESLRVYYEGLDVNESFDAVRDKIREHLRQRRAARAKAAYLQSLRKNALIALNLPSPRASVSLANAPFRGAAAAPVTIIEYADYECPYCQQIQPALDLIEATYKGKLSFAYKDVPLPIHANAQKAAEAKHCAGAQGKYWEFHDRLVATKEFNIDSLKQHARALKLNGEVFDKCLDSGEQAAIIKAHVAEAQGFGIQGTPSFFINGRFFSGVLTAEKLREVIEEELRASNQNAAAAGGR